MNVAQYLVAKYVPDLQRQEPRNIGVIIWTPEVVLARFQGERQKSAGQIVLDGRSIPDYVRCHSAYRQWIEFWRNEIQKHHIFSPQPKALVPRTSTEFLPALQASNKGNFLLAAGGSVLDVVDSANVADALDFLFKLLVEEVLTSEPAQDPTLEHLCNALIAETRLGSHPWFRRSYGVECPLEGTASEYFEFNYAYENGSLKRLYHRVSLPRKLWALKRNVDVAAWMFHNVISSRLVNRDHTAALVYLPDDQQSDPETTMLLGVLGSVTRVLNLYDSNAARTEFLALAGEVL